MRYRILFFLLFATALSAKPIAPPEFDTPEKRLFFFTCDGNIEGIDAALAEGADINAVEKDSYPPLHISIYQENHEVFDHLLKKGADIHMFSDFGNCNALSLASIYDRREMVLKLLDAGADPNAAEEERYMKEYSAIAYAALYGHVDLLKLFAARGGDLERPLRWPMWRGIPPEFPLLSVAAQHGGLDVVRYLVEERGHVVNPAGKIPVLPPLSVAVRYNNMEVAKYLIAKGADVNAVGYDYYYQSTRSDYKSNWLSPLGVAARYNRAEMVELLFAHGAKIREDVEEANHPMYWADWAGYYRVTEVFEKQGYTFDKWAVIERQFRSERSRKKESEPTGNASDFAPTFLRGHTRQWGISDEAELAAPLRLAVVADSQSEELADLLTVALSGKVQLELIERSALDAVLQEQQLNLAGLTDGKTLSRVSKLLDAQALVLIETLTVNKQQVFQLRLVNSILGLQFGRHFIERDPATLQASLENYAGTVIALTNTFRRNYEQAIPLSLVNVRSDLGTVEGLKIENTLKQLLELQFLGQPSVILTQRKNLEALIREKDLGGREEEFEASSIFVDLGVQLDAGGEQPESYTLRIQPASGETFILELTADGKTLEESSAAICRAVMERINADYTASESELKAALSRDAETYFEEALWHFNLEQYEECLDNIRTGISLGYSKREIWDYYYRAIQLLIDDHRKHPGDDANNRIVLALERERLVALEGILKLYRADVTGHTLRAPKFGNHVRESLETGGIVETFERFRPVAMQRRYAKELHAIERQFLHLVNDYIIPCYTRPKAHGKYPLKRSLRDLFQTIDVMAQMDESIYEKTLDDLMKAIREWESRKKRRNPPYWGRPVWTDPPVASPRWVSVSLKYLNEQETFLRSFYRLCVSYLPKLSKQKSPDVPMSIHGRRLLAGHIEQGLENLSGDDDASRADFFLRKLAYERGFGLKEPGDWLPEEGAIPRSFQRIPMDRRLYYQSVNYETWLIRYDVARQMPPRGRSGDPFSHVETLSMALNAFKGAVEDGHAEDIGMHPKRIEAKINEYKERLAALRDESSGNPEEIRISELPVRLWSPEKNGFPEFEPGRSWLLHSPIAHDNGWWVLAKVNGASSTGTEHSRYAILRINPETLQTEVRWLPEPPGQGIYYCPAATIVGRWLAVSGQGKPITLIHLDTMETRQLSEFVPSYGNRHLLDESISACGKWFFFFVQPAENVGEDRWEKPEMQMLVRYDPEADEREVVYNTRRNPPQTLLDGTGAVFSRMVDTEAGALILSEDAGRKHFRVDCATLEIRKAKGQEIRAARKQGHEPSNFDRGRTKLHPFPFWVLLMPSLNRDQPLPGETVTRAREFMQRYRNVESFKLIKPTPTKGDPSRVKFNELCARLTKFHNQPYLPERNRWFGEEYGYFNYSDDDDFMWCIFEMSDLNQALENSPNLLNYISR